MNKVVTLSVDKLELLKTVLLENNAEIKDINSGCIFKVNSTNISIYNSGKVLVQGKEAELWFDKIMGEFSDMSQDSPKDHIPSGSQYQDLMIYSGVYPRVGTDESGKGDFFGPLVTASFALESEKVEKLLIELGVADSKKKTDARILELAPKIKKMGNYHIVKIGPDKYNNLYMKMKNINKILGWSHARAIENILNISKAELAIADQFGDESIINSSLFKLGKSIKLVQTPKAERDMAVAAASILARDAFIRAVKDLEIKFNSRFPLGAGKSVIDAGKKFVDNYGVDALLNVSKLHFKTLEQIK